MLVNKDTINDLRVRFKLNIYEVKIWTSLLSRGIAAASELADISGVPRSRCYDVLEGLEKKGFIIMKIGKPIKYIAVQPDVVVDRVKGRFQEDAEEQIKVVDQLGKTDLFRELELLHKTGIKKVNVENITDSVVGRNNVNKLVKEMLLRAKKNVTILSNEDGLKHKIKVLKKAHPYLAKKKIKVRLYTNANLQNVSLPNVEILKTDYDSRFVNVDNEEIFFVMAGKEPDYDLGVWIKSPYFVNALNSLFELKVR